LTTTQIINDPAIIEKCAGLISDISNRRAEAGLPATELRRLEQAIEKLQAELEKPQPETSLVQEGLITVRGVLEKAAGGVLAGYWLPLLGAIHKALS
jgi:RNA polymerase-interacting CarD/CdnL/TRCF family regulator